MGVAAAAREDPAMSGVQRVARRGRPSLLSGRGAADPERCESGKSGVQTAAGAGTPIPRRLGRRGGSWPRWASGACFAAWRFAVTDRPRPAPSPLRGRRFCRRWILLDSAISTRSSFLGARSGRDGSPGRTSFMHVLTEPPVVNASRARTVPRVERPLSRGLARIGAQNPDEAEPIRLVVWGRSTRRSRSCTETLNSDLPRRGGREGSLR